VSSKPGAGQLCFSAWVRPLVRRPIGTFSDRRTGDQANSDAVLRTLEARSSVADWPAPETELEDHLFSAITLIFVEPGRSERARRALRSALGGRRFEHLLGLLAFIRMAHYWTVLHPDLQSEEDILDLLRVNEELARLLLQDPEAARCDLSSRLFSELEDLRGLNERRELEKAKRALEAQVEQGTLAEGGQPPDQEQPANRIQYSPLTAIPHPKHRSY
jgi:hypothetical protein